jgi:hypothetical protein
MTTQSDQWDLPEAARRRRAAGIYGTIVTAAVFAAAGDELTSDQLAISVFVTLLVYWLAEQYAYTLARYATPRHLPTSAQVHSSLATTWPMVSSTFIPMAALLVADVLGASTHVASDIGLGVAIALLVVHGWSAGRAAGLRGTRLVVVVLIAGALGAIMVSLKAGLELLGH